MTRVLLYSPANLNTMDGSSIWVQSVAETLAADPLVEIVLPLKAPVRRDLITGALRGRPRIEVLEPSTFRRRTPPSGLKLDDALDWIERLDRERRFDVFLLRSFEVCLAAAERPGLRGRLWSTYILEPERDPSSAPYLADIARIIEASEYAVCQSEEMRQVLEQLVPAARNRTILLPPAIPAGVPRADPRNVARRLIYTGKFHPFYPVPDLIDAFVELRARRHRTLDFHVVGDKIWRTPDDHAYADALEQRLGSTAGLVWHGAISRAAVAELLAQGGIALNIWDHRFGPRSNDLVVSTKLLDYCAAGIPVVLNRTIAQEGILGEDYPLFVERVDEVPGLLERVLDDPGLYRSAAARCWSATRRFTYESVVGRLAPFLARPPEPAAVAAALAARAKLEGAPLTVGVRVDGADEPVDGADEPADGPDDDDGGRFGRSSRSLELLRALRALDDRFRLSVLVGPDVEMAARVRLAVGEDPSLDRATTVECGLDAAAWAMTVGWQVTRWAGQAARLVDGSDGPGTPDGSIPVLLPAGRLDSAAVRASIAALAAEIVDIVHSDGWAGRSSAGMAAVDVATPGRGPTR